MKRPIKYINFIVLLFSVSLLFSLQSYTQLSTSLLSILPKSEFKELITAFSKTQNSKVLLLSVKGLDNKALNKIIILEKELNDWSLVTQKTIQSNIPFVEQKEADKLYTQRINMDKLEKINIKNELKRIYDEISGSFFPVAVDRQDPFGLLQQDKLANFTFKNGHLTLDDYGYISYFTLHSNTLKEHQELYTKIQNLVKNDNAITVFSPIFYYVENSSAIRSDVNKIILFATGILLLLYLFILRDIPLLLNTVATLGTSAMIATILITQLYSEVSIFVFVFGVSISSIAVDYMFHHYVHDYYVERKPLNKEVLFGFLTTISAFLILSFTSFILIRQISLFAVFSLLISYLIFAFLYPKIGFKKFNYKSLFHLNYHFISSKILLVLSLVLILFSTSWIHFDFDLKNLDYDNKKLKKTEQFFTKHLESNTDISFALKANNLDTLIYNAQTIHADFPSIPMPLSSFTSKLSYENNKKILSSLQAFRSEIKKEAKILGFQDDYFKKAYNSEKVFIPPTEEIIKSYGIDIVKINNLYYTYGKVDTKLYTDLLKYDFVESLSVKERFNSDMHRSMDMLIKLGLFALFIILLLLYMITRNAIFYAILFLLFPISMVGIYAYFSAFNILHIFMLFIILAIGIDYAIYLSKSNDILTKKAITYSLISTFAGFGVLIFSQINALYSMGIVATIGILSVFFLLLFVKGTHNES